MIRVLFFALLAAGVVSVSASRADVEVAPPPREIRADGSRDPAPMPEVVKKEDPREVVERIIKNSKAVGDKLAQTDTGTDTQQAQSKILKDIDALLNKDDPPPQPDKNDMNMNPDMNPDMSKDKKDMKDKDMKSDMMPMGGMGDKKMDMMPMGGGGGSGMDQQPMGGGQPRERRPRQQGGDKKDQQQPKDQNMGAGGSGNQQKQPANPKDPKNTGGKTPDPHGDKPPPPSGLPLFPTDDDVARQAWGHLPDKLRQQATQYYKQDFMPRYAELLKQYYSSMNEKK